MVAGSGFRCKGCTSGLEVFRMPARIPKPMSETATVTTLRIAVYCTSTVGANAAAAAPCRAA